MTSLPPPQGPPASLVPPGGATRRRSRRHGWIAGALLAVGLIGGTALFVEGGQRMEVAAQRMVRVSAGCRVLVTLQRTDSFHVYLEDRAANMPASADCTLRTRLEAIPPASGVNPHGSAVIGYSVVARNNVERSMFEIRNGRTYEAGRYRGELASRFEGVSGETLEVTVVADQAEAAIAIGEDVFAVRRPWRIGSGITVAAGCIGALLVMSRRRVRVDASL
jgi:hypothetical protein